ncbi:MAG: glycosyltransferase [Proteobacteria bacterium]|nr:MAG: glycosyltransferase [Pseudomonadota bacterium]
MDSYSKPHIRVALVQRILAHYRGALFRNLDSSEVLDITFFSSGHDQGGIVHLPVDSVKRLSVAPLQVYRGISWQSGAVRAALSKDFDALILMGDPHYISSWVAAAVARLRGVPILFWTHGWRKPERGVRRLFRLAFYRLANELLIYSERGKQLGVASGYPEERMTVIYNSLNLGRADEVVASIEAGDIQGNPTSLFSSPGRPLIICTARLTQKCRFDLLLKAASHLAGRGRPINVLLVGDGPARADLEALSSDLKVDAHFAGAIYDEAVLGSLIYHADITVSPGKVGLTAIHSMMYGTPVITHGNLDAQMPEVETVVEGATGALFRQNDEADLASKIQEWLDAGRDRTELRQACRALIHSSWSPTRQAACMEAGVLKAIRSKDRY